MKLAHCNEHAGSEDLGLPCYLLRHDDGRKATPQEIQGELSNLRAAITGLLKFHQEGDDGADLPREYWSPGYLEAVEIAESLMGSNVGIEPRR